MVLDQKAPPKESYQDRIDRLSHHPKRHRSSSVMSDSSISSLGASEVPPCPTDHSEGVAASSSHLSIPACSSAGNSNDKDYEDERSVGSGLLLDGDAASDKCLPPDIKIYLRIMAQTRTSSSPSFYCKEFCNGNYKGSPTNLCVSDDIPVEDFVDTIANILTARDLYMTHSRNANLGQIYVRNSPPISLGVDDIKTENVTALNKENFRFATLLSCSGFEISSVAVDEDTVSDEEQISQIDEYVLDVFVYCTRNTKRNSGEARLSINVSPKKKKKSHEKVPLCKLDVRVLPPIFKNTEKNVYETKEVPSIDSLPNLDIDAGDETVTWGYVQQSVLRYCREDERYFRNKLPALGNDPQLFILDRRGARKCVELNSTQKMWGIFLQGILRGRNMQKKGK